MSTINDLGNQNLKEQSRVYNLEINTPYNGRSSLIFRREKLLLVNNSVISQSQIEPIIKNFSESARDTITVFDPITRTETTISILALVEAIQKIGQ
jgi:hypothetical protein